MDTLSRQWDILEMIPREPRTITAAKLQDRLRGQGHDVDVRTIQRDLAMLETKFMLHCRTEGRVNHWCWGRTQKSLEIPRLSGAEGITLLLAREHLSSLLQGPVSDALEPQFAKAEEALKGTKLESWRNRVRMVARGPLLGTPSIEPDVQRVVYDALLEGHRIEADYRSRDAESARQFTINPLGLVAKHGVLYLVATLFSYADVRQLALHRMSGARRLDEPSSVPESFDLDAYLEDDAAFAYPVSGDPIELVARFDPGPAAHLHERRLSSDQRLEPFEDGSVLLRASVADTQELRWWLLGFGEQVEVLEPERLRSELGEVACAMARRYAPAAERAAG